jgi:FtsH-binding integral membrane protein
MNTSFYPTTVAESSPLARAEFIRKTYAHLTGALAAFVAVEYLLLNSGFAESFLRILGTGRMSWLIVLGAFMVISWVAQWLANSGASAGAQYAGLGLYVAADAVIFVPILYMAQRYAGPNTISIAALITWALFGGLTAIVFTTRKDFSFMGAGLQTAGFIAVGVVIASMIFGFNLGVLFAGIMVLFAAAAILYHTSEVLHRYQPGQHVAASLCLFASVALLFWYVLRVVMSLNRR